MLQFGLRAAAALMAIVSTLTVVAATVVAATSIEPALAADHGASARRKTLSKILSWHYQLQRADVDQLSGSPADLLVIDYAAGRPQRPLGSDDVTKLKSKPEGGRRIVLAYLSIGEAEEYRFYWKPEWNQTRPAWLVGENCNWPRNHLVRFWHDDWKSIVMAGADSYLGRIQQAGFDGVYLDLVDAYEPLQRERPDSRADMIAFVTGLANTARRKQPQFMVFPQNGDELLTDRRYREMVDGIGREGVMFRPEKGRRKPERVRDDVERLQLLRKAGKPVLVVEYVSTQEDADTARAELGQLGFVPVIAPRALDGRDPLAPKTPLTSMKAPAAVQHEHQPVRECVSY